MVQSKIKAIIQILRIYVYIYLPSDTQKQFYIEACIHTVGIHISEWNDFFPLTEIFIRKKTTCIRVE